MKNSNIPACKTTAAKTCKEIFLYFFRIFIFLLLNRNFAYKLSFYIINPIFDALFKGNNFDPFFCMGLYGLFAFALHGYVTQKLCGLFKKLDDLNFFKGTFIVIVVDIIYNIMLQTTIQISPAIKFSYHKTDFFPILTILFLIYKFFNFLSKKFILFRKIGYYSSIEFWKNLNKKKW